MAPLRAVNGILTEYDALVDVLYVTLMEPDVDSNEMSYAENVEDMVFIMRTVRSDTLLGFEILDAKYHGPRKVWQVLLPVIENEKRRIRGTLPELQAKLEELEQMHLEDLVPA